MGEHAHLLLVDGSNLMSRAYHTMRAPSLDGLPAKVRAMLASAVRRWEPSHLMFALDSPDCFRRAAIPGYKADRADRRAPSTEQMTDALRPALADWGAALRETPHMEADDVIAALADAACTAGCAVSILTRDTDLLQLVDDARRVRVLWPTGKGEAETPMDEDGVAEYLAGHKDFGTAFPPRRLLDLRAIAGGKDNLPRIELRDGPPPYGFTTKRTAALMADGATLDTLQGADAWRLTPRETRWVAAGIEAAARRLDALTLRSFVLPSGTGRSAVSATSLAVGGAHG